MRAPFALAADALGGGPVAVFRAVGMPCLLAGSALGDRARLEPARPRRRTRHDRDRGRAVRGNPITLRALDIGHPEELLGAVLCAGAVLAALRGRATLAGVLLGLAMANKAWAVLAVGPVLLALPERRRWSLLIAGAIALAFVLPLLLAAPPSASPGGAVHTNEIFQPWQVWWFLGRPAR